jgi:hypothetical protein
MRDPVQLHRVELRMCDACLDNVLRVCDVVGCCGNASVAGTALRHDPAFVAIDGWKMCAACNARRAERNHYDEITREQSQMCIGCFVSAVAKDERVLIEAKEALERMGLGR